jgi:micrococcal nuclease
LHNNRAERIRLSGIDCPEKGQAYGTRAKRAASELVLGGEVTLQTYGKDKYGRTIADVLLLDGTNVNHTLVEDGWCWWYRMCAAGDTVLEGLETEAREARKGVWADPQSVPPWEWRKRKSRSWAGLFLGVGAHLRSSQRDHDFRAKIKFLPLTRTRFVAETGRAR